ncbi:hypothetical protein DIE19_31605 [Burkholderia sp. Bp9126]|nr:hypothetical protein DIE19_31605 [Burkholderia sp. Bp9126]
MADLVESSTWTPGIRQFETSDPVEGGPDGIDNVPLRQLANRTRFLKDAQGAHTEDHNPHPQYATIMQMQAAVSALVDAAPGALDTLNDLAKALGNDPNFATTMTNALALKAAIDSPIFTGTPKAPTPAQFDSSTKLATTAFMRAAGFQFGGEYVFSSSVALPVSAIGSLAVFNGSANATLTLPAVGSVPVGSTITIFNVTNYTCTVSRGGSDSIGVNSGIVASLALGNGDTLVLESNAVSGWRAIGGTATLGNSSAFAASQSINGYQKLPGGLIIQWGGITCPANYSANQVVYFNFPIAFPSQVLQLVGSNSGIAVATATEAQANSLSQGQVYWGASSASAGGLAFAYIAIGR